MTITGIFSGLFEGPGNPAVQAEVAFTLLKSRLEEAGGGRSVLVVQRTATHSPGMPDHWRLRADLQVREMLVRYDADWVGARNSLPAPSLRGFRAELASFESGNRFDGAEIQRLPVPNRYIACHLAWLVWLRNILAADPSTEPNDPVEKALQSRWHTTRREAEALKAKVERIAADSHRRVVELVDGQPRANQPSGETMAAAPIYWLSELDQLGCDVDARRLVRADAAVTLLTWVIGMQPIRTNHNGSGPSRSAPPGSGGKDESRHSPRHGRRGEGR